MEQNTTSRTLSKDRSCLLKKGFEVLIEELAKPEFGLAEISQYSSLLISNMQRQNMMVVPKLIDFIKKQNQPLVLEITKSTRASQSHSLKIKEKYLQKRQQVNKVKRPRCKRTLKSVVLPAPPPPPAVPEEKEEVKITENEIMTFYSTTEILEETTLQKSPAPAYEPHASMRSTLETVETERTNSATQEGAKQIEIIFSDSNRPTDLESDQHIIHSITERSATSNLEQNGPVNVPDSFPLFQIIHNTGEELPEELQQEIVRLIKEANPKLDLNSITFKLKSPHTVEIIANVNS